jgi:hypothetical protein
VHRHKDALDQAKEGVRISHQLINDMKQLCEFYVRREEIQTANNHNISRNSNLQNPTHKESNSGDFNNYNSYYSSIGQKPNSKL